MGYVLGQAIKTYRSDPERWISYSRNKNWYYEPGRQQYFPVRAPYGGMVGAVDQLAATGAIEHRKTPRGNLGQQSSFRATPDLYRAYTERPMPLICTPRERIILRDGDGRLAPYQNSRDTDRWRKQVLRFNEESAQGILHARLPFQFLPQAVPCLRERQAGRINH